MHQRQKATKALRRPTIKPVFRLIYIHALRAYHNKL